MKRFLAIIIATMLVVGMLPTTFAAETDLNNAEYNEWVFTYGSHGYTSEDITESEPFIGMITQTSEQKTAKSATSNFSLADTVTGDKWAFVNQVGSSDMRAYSDHLRWTFKTADATGSDIVYSPDTDTNALSVKSAFVFELDVTVSGAVTPYISFFATPNSPTYEAFLVKIDGSDAKHTLANWLCSKAGNYAQKGFRESYVAQMNSSERLGTVNAYSAEETVKRVSFPKVNVTEGSYLLVLVANGKDAAWTPLVIGSSNYGILKLKSFMLSESPSAKEAFYNYDITTNALASTAQADYGNMIGTANNVIDNSELQYVSWEATVTGKSPALDLSKTDGYKLPGRSRCDTSVGFNEHGMYSTLNVGTGTGVTTENNVTVPTWTTKNFEQGTIDRPIYAVKLKIPYSGEYDISTINKFEIEDAVLNDATSSWSKVNGGVKSDTSYDTGSITEVYLVDASGLEFKYEKGNGKSLSDIGNLDSLLVNDAYIGTHDSGNIATSETMPAVNKIGTKEIEAGEYYLVFNYNANSYNLNNKCWYRNQSGTYYFRQMFLLSGIQLTLVEDTEQAAAQEVYDAIVNEDGNPAEPETLATGSKSFVKILSSKGKEPLYNKEHTAGDTITYTATGDDFLYWAQGIDAYRTAISDNPKLSIKAEKGAMYIYAVYAKDSDTTEVVFYNGNKAEISRKSYADGATIEMETLPSMAGFKDAASAWICVEDGKEYTAENPATASGKLMRFVAKYPDVADETFNVTAVNGTADKATVTYGETVTVTAPLRKNNTSTLLFNYWEKDGEIVSFDESYSFRVYKDTTVTAVYKEYQPLAESVRKIILGTRTVGNEAAVVAEFINVTDVVEKGIMFGGTSLDDATHKVAMKGTDNFFSVIHDVSGAAKGYAILSDGSVIYSE